MRKRWFIVGFLSATVYQGVKGLQKIRSGEVKINLDKYPAKKRQIMQDIIDHGIIKAYDLAINRKIYS